MRQKNDELWERALSVIPWGTQTNAKRVVPALADEMPAFIERARGCRIWDADGRQYIDYRSSLGPIVLGHGHPAVQAAVLAQLEQGVLFSMASPLEIEAACAVRKMAPNAERVRFLKTGGDAVQACVRLARAFTGRDLIITTGYHGWQDPFAAVNAAGVPGAVRDLTLRCPFGDEERLARLFADHPGCIAAVVAIPYDWGQDTSGRFPRVARDLATRQGALLIFDEVLTGFRMARGGAAEYYRIVPDLVAYAKALANGYPLAAFAGLAEYMDVLDRTVVTTTYAGETLSLAAALATLGVMSAEPVHDTIWRRGSELMAGLTGILQEFELPGEVYGLPPYFNLVFHSGDAERDARLYGTFYRELFRQGIFSTGPWLLSYAHTADDLQETLLAAAAAARVAAAG